VEDFITLNSLCWEEIDDLTFYIGLTGNQIKQNKVAVEKGKAVKVINLGGNRGYAGGMNILMHSALVDHAETNNRLYFLLINPDIKLERGMIEALKNIHVQVPEIFCLSPKENNEKHKKIENSVLRRIQERRRAQKDYIGIKRIKLCVAGYSLEKTVAECTGACMMVKGNIVDREVGFFNEDYFLYLEETELIYRAMELGYPSYVVNEYNIEHNENEERYTERKCYYTARNSLKLISYIGLIYKPATVMARIIYPSVKLGYSFLSRRRLDLIGASLAGFIDGARGRKGIKERMHNK